MSRDTSSKKRKRSQTELEIELWGFAGTGDLEGLRELIEIDRSVNVDCTNDYGVTPLKMAIYYGHTPIARYLLQQGAHVNAKDQDNETALVTAMRRSHVGQVQLLLEYGADIETPCPVAYIRDLAHSPLAHAISEAGPVELVELLLRFGANTVETTYCSERFTALYLVCHLCDNMREGVTRSLEMARLLLDHGNNNDDNVVNTFFLMDDSAMSPLCWACVGKNLELVQLLVRHGAQVVYNGDYPEVPCPLKHAIEHGSLELVQFLVDNAHLPEVANGTLHPFSAPLRAAISEGILEAAQLLIDHGANVNDEPFLWECAKHGCCEIARILLCAGSNVNQSSNHGETPLWMAAKKGNAAMVRLLLKARANVKIRDNGGETPLGVAQRKGHAHVVYLLLRTSPHVWPRLEKVI